MKARKIITDRSFPGETEINQFKNFEKIKAQHLLARKHFFKKIWFGAGAAVLVSVGLIALLYVNANQATEKVKNTEETIRAYNAIEPPIAGLDVPYTTFTLNGKDGGTIIHRSGSQLVFPKEAFVDNNNDVVVGELEILYREFQNPGDIFCAGVPMTCDSTGTVYQLASAGMFEIKAVASGQALQLCAGKHVEVRLSSHSKDNLFGMFVLDTVAKNWKGYEATKTITNHFITNNTKLSNSTITVASGNTDVTANMPNIPAKADDSKFKFKIEFDPKYFPELAEFKNIQFEVVDKNFGYKFYEMEWEEMNLTAGKNKGEYTMKLFKADTSVDVQVKPVLDNNAYQKALKEFEEKQKAYHLLQGENMEAEKQTNKQSNSEEASKRVDASKQTNQANIIKSFTISKLGYYCNGTILKDVLPDISKYTESDSGHKDEKFSDLHFSVIYMGIPGINTVYRYNSMRAIPAGITLNPLIWTVTSKGLIAFFALEDFSKPADNNNGQAIPKVASDQKAAMDRISSLNS